jgi:glycosyltransferase involved in cell wall biosynthesis
VASNPKQASLRITFVIGTLDIGGTERQLTRLAIELQSLGHDVDVLCLSKGGPLSRDLDRAGVRWTTFGWTGFWRGEDGRRHLAVFIEQLRKLVDLALYLRRRRPDVCHTFLFWGNAVGILAAFAVRVPVRVSGRRSMVQDLEGPRNARLRSALSWLVNSLSQAIVANAEAVARDVVRAELAPRRKLRVIRNGVDLPDEQAKPGTDPPRGVMIANFHVYKGQADVVRALSLIEEPPSVTFAGDGASRHEVEQLSCELGIAPVLEFVGEIADPASVYLRAQFALLPSHFEGLPNALLEAMAFGLPVIATSVGGIPEVIEHGVSGLLVPPESPDVLAAAIMQLAGDSDLRLRLGAAARRRAASFAWPQCRDAHVNLYSSLLSMRPA